MPRFSQFYTSSIDLLPSHGNKPYPELLEEARLHGAQSWPDGSRYTIIDAIAVGGMGAVLKAHDNHASRDVAMKIVVSPETESLVVQRFIRESRILASLEHPNIVPLHDIGSSPLGDPYFTMKLIQGESLADILYQLRMKMPEYLEYYTLPVLLDIIVKVCDGVGFAHSRNIVHLDLKPHNILVGAFGEVLLLDWGLATILGDRTAESDHYDDGEGGTPNVQPDQPKYDYGRFTADGTIKGTPGFMAPEQADGNVAEVDQQSDVFSLGAIVYMTLTLKTPIVGENFSEIVQHTIDGNFVPPGRRSRQEPVAAELEAIVMKAMSVDKSGRFDSVDALRDALNGYLMGNMTLTEGTGSLDRLLAACSRRKRELIIATAALVVLLAAIPLISRQFVEIRRERARHRAIVDNAVAAANRAHREKEIAVLNQDRADSAGERAAFNAYVSSLRLAVIGMQQHRFDVALPALERCPMSLRHWEWGRLRYLSRGAEFVYRPAPDLPALPSVSNNGQIVDRENGIVILRDINTGKRTAQLNHIDSSFSDITLTRDGSKVITIGEGLAIKVWDVATGKLHRLLGATTDRLATVSVSANGQYLATSLEGGDIAVWHLGTGRRIRSFSSRSDTAVVLALYRNGDRVVTGDRGGRVFVWECDTGVPLMTMTGPVSRVNAVAVSDDGRYVAAAGTDHDVRIWSGIDGELLNRIVVHTASVRSVEFTRDGSAVLTAGDDALIALSDVRSGEVEIQVAVNGAALRSASINRDRTKVASLSEDGTLRVWALDRFLNQQSVTNVGSAVRALALSHDRHMLAVGTDDRGIQIIDTDTGRQSTSFTDSESAVTALAFTDDGQNLVGVDGAASACVRRLKSERKRVVLRGHRDTIASVAVGPAGRMILTASRDRTVRSWSAVNGHELAVFSGHEHAVIAAFFVGSDAEAASVDHAGIYLWNTRTGTVLRTVPFSPGNGTAACMSDDGGTLVIGTTSGNVAVVDLMAEAVTMSHHGHRGAVTVVALSSDGRRIFSGGLDRAVRVWDRATLEELITLDGHGAGVTAIVAATARRMVYSGDAAGNIIFWDSVDWSGQPEN